MALTQGAPLPNITTTTTQASAAPEYYTNYLTGLSQAGTQAMGRTPQQMVAGYDPMQTQGYAAVPGAATAYQPGLSAAQQTVAGVAGGITPQRISSFMNPYTQSVVDEMARLSQQNVQRNLLPTLKAGFVGSGGLGGQRYAGALGQTMADVQSNLTGQQAGALRSGYQEALKAAMDEAALQRQAAETQGSLAGRAQEYGLTGAGALTKAGAERQAYQQSLLDAPLKTASATSKLLSGYQVPLGTTTSVTGPGQQGQYQISPLNQVAGLLALLGATQTGQGGQTGQTSGTGGTGGSIVTGQNIGAGTNLISGLVQRFLPNVITGDTNQTPEAQQALADYILNYNAENYG